MEGLRREKEEIRETWHGGWVGGEVRSKEPQVKPNHSGWNRGVRWVYEGTCSTSGGHIPYCDLSVRGGQIGNFWRQPFSLWTPLDIGVLNTDPCVSTCKALNKYQ